MNAGPSLVAARVSVWTIVSRPRFFSRCVAAVILPCALSAAELHLAQGIVIGEVTATSAILQTRLTATPKLDASGDVPGADGVVSFELSTAESFASSALTGGTRWLTARSGADFIVRTVAANLRPGTRYFYRARFGPSDHAPGDASAFRVSPVGSSRVDLQACKLEYSIVSPK